MRVIDNMHRKLTSGQEYWVREVLTNMYYSFNPVVPGLHSSNDVVRLLSKSKEVSSLLKELCNSEDMMEIFNIISYGSSYTHVLFDAFYKLISLPLDIPATIRTVDWELADYIIYKLQSAVDNPGSNICLTFNYCEITLNKEVDKFKEDNFKRGFTKESVKCTYFEKAPNYYYDDENGDYTNSIESYTCTYTFSIGNNYLVDIFPDGDDYKITLYGEFNTLQEYEVSTIPLKANNH